MVCLEKMIPINLGFIIFSIFILTWTVIESELPPESDSIMIWWSYSVMIIEGIIGLMILYLVFISLPKYMVRSIEKKQKLIIKEISKTNKLKEIQDTGLKVVKTSSNKTGIDFLTRVIIQFIGSLIIGFIFAYLVYEKPTPNPGNFLGPLGTWVFTGVVFIVGFTFSFASIWLLFYFFKKARKFI